LALVVGSPLHAVSPVHLACALLCDLYVGSVLAPSWVASLWQLRAVVSLVVVVAHSPSYLGTFRVGSYRIVSWISTSSCPRLRQVIALAIACHVLIESAGRPYLRHWLLIRSRLGLTASWPKTIAAPQRCGIETCALPIVSLY
jgi:hypothetical protein